MPFQNQVRLAIVATLLAPYTTLLAQQASIQDAIKGKLGKYATTIKISELPDDFSAARIISGGPGPNPWESVLPLMAMGDGTGGRNSSKPNLFKLVQSCWSNGDILKIESRDYLVTYRVDLDPTYLVLLQRSGANSFGDMPKPQSRPSLRLTLVALEGIQTITPVPEVSKRDLESTFNLDSQPQATAGNGGTQTSTLSNIKQESLALIMYAGDYDDVLPYAQSTAAVQFVTMPYTKNKEIWKTYNPKGGMIRFNMALAGVEMVSIPDPAQTVLLFETEAWSDGRRAVAFADGHAKLVTTEDWNRMLPNMKVKGVKRHGKPLPANLGLTPIAR